MQDRNQQNNRPDDLTSKNYDRQGVDKDPAKDAPGEVKNVVSETQKGKNKVDGDPTRASDQPSKEDI